MHTQSLCRALATTLSLAVIMALVGCASNGYGQYAAKNYLETVVDSSIYTSNSRKETANWYGSQMQEIYAECIINLERKKKRRQGYLTDAQIAQIKAFCRNSNETVIDRQRAKIRYDRRMDDITRDHNQRIERARTNIIQRFIDGLLSDL